MGSGVVSLIAIMGVAGLTSVLVSLIRAFVVKRGLLGALPASGPTGGGAGVPSAREHVPRGGGLALVVVTLVAWLLLGIFYTENEWSPWVFIVGGGVVAGCGLADDLHGVARSTRVFVHFAVAVFVVATLDVPSIGLPFIGEISAWWLLWPVWVLWLTGLANAYKFMVGVDGIASQQALFAGLLWGSLGLAVDDSLLQLSGLCLVGGALGSIRYEWPPARIFMGDVGTTFLGFTLAVLTLYAALLAPHFAWAGCLVVWPFAFDSLFSGVRGLFRRMPLDGAKRVHLHQRLVATGVSHRNATLFYGLLSLVCAVTAGGYATSHGLAAEIAAVAVPAAVACVMWTATVARERRARVSPS